jgi:hydrogenase maturation protease
VLYEGYILYPYRRSAVKNQQRWTFGGLYPRAWSERGHGDGSNQQTQCLVEDGTEAEVEVRVRCLHLIDRQVGEIVASGDWLPEHGEPEWTPVASLDVDGRQYYSWQEAAEREAVLPAERIAALCAEPLRVPFEFEASREWEPIQDNAGQIAGLLVRSQRRISGEVTVSAKRLDTGLYRLTVRTDNLTDLDAPVDLNRDTASLYSLASTHVVMGIAGGAFVSLIDPPEGLKEAAAACRNEGCFPVLVGREGERDTLFASPIILYDYPKVAPESPGDLFDGTEIDEILSLRILAMTDAEKREVAATDPHARALLERTESLSAEDMQRLHGAMRGLRPMTGPGHVNAAPSLAALGLGERSLAVGDRVRLHPKSGGDVMDMALQGKTAVIEGIDRDFEDRTYVAVAIDDDPGRDLGLSRMPGHRFFFSLEEVEAVEPEAR